MTKYATFNIGLSADMNTEKVLQPDQEKSVVEIKSSKTIFSLHNMCRNQNLK